jgi:cell division protein FtsL
VAALDWFATDVATPIPRRPERPEAAPRPRRRAQGRRLTGGIVWITAFAVLLAGVVALNVAVLRVNMSLDRLNKQQIELQAENTALASQLSAAGSSLRIEQAARRLGLVPAPASDTSYLDVGH